MCLVVQLQLIRGAQVIQVLRCSAVQQNEMDGRNLVTMGLPWQQCNLQWGNHDNSVTYNWYSVRFQKCLKAHPVHLNPGRRHGKTGVLLARLKAGTGWYYLGRAGIMVTRYHVKYVYMCETSVYNVLWGWVVSWVSSGVLYSCDPYMSRSTEIATS